MRIVPPRALLIAAGAYALYIVAVTVLGIFEDEERVKPRAVQSIQLVCSPAPARTMLYTGLLCLASGRGYEALAIVAAVSIARAIARRIALA